MHKEIIKHVFLLCVCFAGSNSTTDMINVYGALHFNCFFFNQVTVVLCFLLYKRCLPSVLSSRYDVCNM